jgi:Zn-finger nucleic acid-binding protein
MKCPVCPEIVLCVGNREGIEIDYCPACRGVWLDRNELDKIIERSARLDSNLHHDGDRPRRSDAPVQGPHPSQHPQHFGSSNDSSHGNIRYEEPRRKKKGGWLGDLLDF